MEKTSINPIKYVVIFTLLIFIVAGLFLLPFIAGRAQTLNQSARSQKPALFSDAIAANTLCSAGLGCERAKEAANSNSGQQTGSSLLGNIFGGSSRAQVDPIITVVNVPGQTSVYRIINGQKHSIPSTEIFESYGFSLEIVQKITQQELNKYPLAKLFIVEGDSNEDNPTTYYLTEGGMIRPIINDKVFYSYGDRKEDVIAINQKEFNYYPRNQFIFVERPQLNRDVYQITGGVKRYLTPVAVKRMNLKENEIAPVNQIEFDAYPTGETIIF